MRASHEAAAPPRMLAIATVAVLAPGCVTTHGSPTRTVQREPRPSPISVRTDELPGMLCPAGKLPRTQYEAKRALLIADRDRGLLAADDFDRYDADLLRCLE
jgi:hypothetical protein